MPGTEQYLEDLVRAKVAIARQAFPGDTFEALMRDHPAVISFSPSCGDGWVWLLRALAMHLAEHGLPDGFRMSDIKEKYGELRLSAYATTSDLETIFEAYESLSREICEICGEPGKPRGAGWISVLCDLHDRKGV